MLLKYYFAAEKRPEPKIKVLGGPPHQYQDRVYVKISNPFLQDRQIKTILFLLLKSCKKIPRHSQKNPNKGCPCYHTPNITLNWYWAKSCKNLCLLEWSHFRHLRVVICFRWMFLDHYQWISVKKKIESNKAINSGYEMLYRVINTYFFVLTSEYLLYSLLHCAIKWGQEVPNVTQQI